MNKIKTVNFGLLSTSDTQKSFTKKKDFKHKQFKQF